MPQVPIEQLKDYIGKELGHSDWLTVDQERVDRFADCTGDHQFIHVDPSARAKPRSAAPSPTVSSRCR